VNKRRRNLANVLLCLALVLAFSGGWSATRLPRPTPAIPISLHRRAVGSPCCPPAQTIPPICSAPSMRPWRPARARSSTGGRRLSHRADRRRRLPRHLCRRRRRPDGGFQLPYLPVGPGDYWLLKPSPENRYPSLLSFIGGDFTISGLALRIVGEKPMQDWEWAAGVRYNVMACGIMIVGQRPTSRSATSWSKEKGALT